MKKKGVVCAFGTFDIIHPGHIRYLQNAASHGKTLIVVVTTDSVVQRRKGHAPLFNERERMAMVAAVRGVDAAVLGDRADTWSVLMRVSPAVICLGYDQKEARRSLVGSPVYADMGKPPVVVIAAYRPFRYHSSRYTHYA